MKVRISPIKWISILSAMLLIGLSAYLSIHHKMDINPLKSDNLKSYTLNKEQYDSFSIDDVYLEQREHNKIVFSISADKIIHRKRTSRIFTYQNLKEIYISNSKISMYPYNAPSLTHLKHVVLPVQDLSNMMKIYGQAATINSLDDYIKSNADIDLDLITRLIFEGIVINIFQADTKNISISAERGIINIDFRNIVFSGKVRITSLYGESLESPLGVWSNKYNGIYFPKGYLLRNKYRKGRGFFKINDELQLLQVAQIPDIKYDDLIESYENLMYAKLADAFPDYVVYMLGLKKYDEFTK